METLLSTTGNGSDATSTIADAKNSPHASSSSAGSMSAEMPAKLNLRVALLKGNASSLNPTVARLQRRVRSVSFGTLPNETATVVPNVHGGASAKVDKNSTTEDRQTQRQARRMAHMTDLMLASREGEEAQVSSLLAETAGVASLLDKDCRGFDALMYAVRDGHVAVAKLLLDAMCVGGRPSTTGVTAAQRRDSSLSHVIYAALNGHTKCVALLYEYGFDFGASEQGTFTTLMAAAQNGHVDTVSHLLAAEGSSRAGDLAPRESSHDACQKVRSGVDPDVTDCNGWSALSHAAHSGSDTCAAVLVKAHANINLMSNDGCSPLYLAVKGKHNIVGEMLVRAGAIICDKVRYEIVREHQVAQELQAMRARRWREEEVVRRAAVAANRKKVKITSEALVSSDTVIAKESVAKV